MKKVIILIIGILMILITSISYIVVKLPNNFISFDVGYYKNTNVIDMFSYDENIIFVIKNYEVTSSSFDDDQCIDDMLIYVVTDLDGKVIHEKEVSETLTLDNDGDGIRSGEIKVTSAIYESNVYSSVSVNGSKYLIIYDSINNSYQSIDTVYFYDDLLIDDTKIKAVSLFDNGSVQIDYSELSLNGTLLSLDHIGYIDQLNDGDVLNLISPIMNDEFILLRGNLNTQAFSFNDISIYDIASKSFDVIKTDINSEYIEYWKKDNKLYYGVANINEGMVDCYDMDFSFVEQIDENQLEQATTLSYINISETDDMWNKQIILYDKNNDQKITLDFKSKTFIKDMYEFNSELYLVVGTYPGFASQLVNGSNLEYVIHYHINDDGTFGY